MIALTVFVTKANGTKQYFSRKKIIRTCMRMGATRSAAESIADYIETRLYNGVSTKKILQMIFKLLKKHKPAIKYQIDLRKALSLINPAPDFEQYIQLLLTEHGYQVTPNQKIQGRCVEHEVDAIARKNNKVWIVEVKHHYKYHTPTSLDVSRNTRAVFEDLIEGHENGLNDLKINYAMIVCNTKLSEHAKRYADCRGIHHIGWGSPKNGELQTMIEQKKLYPITLLKGLNRENRNRLRSKGIIMLKQLVEKTPVELRRKTGISKEQLKSMINNSLAILTET